MPRSLPILVVDDEEICRLGTALLLKQLGFECVQAATGSDALALIVHGTYGAVIMDYDMPGMTGAECTREIRRLETSTGSRLPVIGMTSHALTEIIKQCLEAGMDAVLPKACAKDELFDVLEPLIFARSPNPSDR